MGKPFQSELECLVETIGWVSNIDLPTGGQSWFSRSRIAYCIGSGGSQSAADFFARLIRSKGGFAWATTPLEYLNLGNVWTPHTSVFTISASGGNKDILAAARLAIENEADHIGAITARTASPLASEISGYSGGTVLELDIPSGKDGFLATNSLIAMMISMLRLASTKYALSDTAQLLKTAEKAVATDPCFQFANTDPEVIIIHAGWGGSAALDLESKLSEAALAPSMLCDLRSFGHGRHHWLAKRSDRTIVVTIEDKEYNTLFTKTLNLLPSGIQIIRLQSEFAGATAAIDLTLKVFSLVRDIGNMLGIDPGRPGVPEFGRKIYHLSPSYQRSPGPKRVEQAAVRRVRQYPAGNADLLMTCTTTLASFKRKLATAEIRAIVLDYDGTLVDTLDRFAAVEDSIASELKRLLQCGLLIGIATGRGKSVQKELRSAIPAKHWAQVLVGYYNGSQIITLNEEKLPETEVRADDQLRNVLALIEQDPWVSHSSAKTEIRPNQISISGTECPITETWFHISRILVHARLPHFKCLASTHSVDIVPVEVSKLNLVEHVSNIAACRADSVLSIGDSGLWPGNDSELLAHFPSLSSGSLHVGLETGWNIAPPGVLESKATLYYLQCLTGTYTMRFNTGRRHEADPC